MAIYDIFAAEKSRNEKEADAAESALARGRFFSCLTARLFFLILFVGDLFWAVYSVCVLLISALITMVSFSRLTFFKNLLSKSWVSIKRALVCGLSLLVALFSPAFGIMIACTYFLMYDKAGMEEIVPTSIQSQFNELFKKEKLEH